MIDRKKWTESNGFEVRFLEPDLDGALMGIMAGNDAYHALYDQEKIIDTLRQRGMSQQEADVAFDAGYYPRIEEPGGPRFLLARYPTVSGSNSSR